MGDEQDGLALLGEAAHDLHELVDLLGGQHGGGLVEDEDLVVAVQHLQDLHALLHAHGDVLDPGVQVHPQAVPLGQVLHLLPGCLLLQEAHFGVLRAQDDVVQDGEHIDELEVLVHHADAQCRCVVGVVDLHRLAVFPDLALLRLVQAEQDGHQRRFAGAVFAQQGVDLTLAQLQGDVVVGLNAGKLLGDVKHFDHILGRLLHAATYFLSFSVCRNRFRGGQYNKFIITSNAGNCKNEPENRAVFTKIVPLSPANRRKKRRPSGRRSFRNKKKENNKRMESGFTCDPRSTCAQ